MNPRRPVTSRQFRDTAKQIISHRWLKAVTVVTPPDPLHHPWTVTAERFTATPTSSLDPDSTWSIFVSDGFVIDTPATFLYQRANDPRGWAVPAGYVDPHPGDTTWWERDALDDPADPPFLVMADPPDVAAANANPARSAWQNVPDSQRPSIEQGAFCGATDWDLELWRGHVILTASPVAQSFFDATLPPPRLVNYRLFTLPTLPGLAYGSQAGGWAEVATLYYLRDPASPDPNSTAEIRILPRIFFDSWAMAIQPGAQLAGLLGSNSGGFAGLIQSQLQNTLSGTTTPEMWSV